jgi:hypothetical protein
LLNGSKLNTLLNTLNLNTQKLNISKLDNAVRESMIVNKSSTSSFEGQWLFNLLSVPLWVGFFFALAGIIIINRRFNKKGIGTVKEVSELFKHYMKFKKGTYSQHRAILEHTQECIEDVFENRLEKMLDRYL